MWLKRIASEFLRRNLNFENLKKEMRAIINFAANNRDAAALRASAIVDRTVRGANFQVGDKVWLLGQNTRKGVNPKLRPRWKGPYLLLIFANKKIVIKVKVIVIIMLLQSAVTTELGRLPNKP